MGDFFSHSGQGIHGLAAVNKYRGVIEPELCTKWIRFRDKTGSTRRQRPNQKKVPQKRDLQTKS